MGKDLQGKDIGKGYTQRPDGRYEARAIINGEKIHMYDMKLSPLKKRFEAAKAGIKTDSDNQTMTLNEWYSDWFTNVKSWQLKSVVSRNVYDRKIRNTYIKLLGSKKLDEITQIDIQTATNKLTESYAHRTVSEALGALRECIDIAILNHKCNINPCKCIFVKDNQEYCERRVLTDAEVKIFLETISSEYYNEAFQILLLTGMRIGEFSGLQWEDVDFVNKCIHVRRSLETGYVDGEKIEQLTTPKTYNSIRDIPFFDETEQLFKDWKIKQDMYRKKLGTRWRCNPEHGNLVFTTTVGSPATRYVVIHAINKIVDNINKRELYKAVEKGCQPTIFEHLHPHAFRHTFATMCFRKKMDPAVVQKIMGHANYATTLSYTHINNYDINKEARAIGKFFA